MDAAVASPVPPIGIPAGGTPTAAPHPAMASGVSALPPPRGSAANMGPDAPASGLATPPVRDGIDAVEAAPGTGAAAMVPVPSAKHREDGRLTSVKDLANDFGSFSMEGAVAPAQPQPSPQPAASSRPQPSSGTLAASSGGEPAEVGMTAVSPAVAAASMAAATGTAAAAGMAAAGAAPAARATAAARSAGMVTSAAWTGSAATPAAGNTQPVEASDRGKLGGLRSIDAGIPNGVAGVPETAAGLPNGGGAVSHGGQASVADVRAYGESAQPQEAVVELWVPLAAVGSVIGSHGTVIKSLQAKSGAMIVVHNGVFDATGSSKMITINGAREAVTMAKRLVDEVVARPRGGGGGGGGGVYASGGGGGRGGPSSEFHSVPAETLTAPDRLRQIASQTGAKLVVIGPANRHSAGSAAGAAVAAAAGGPAGAPTAAADARGTNAAAGPDRPAPPSMVVVQITGRQHAVRNAKSMLDDRNHRPGGGGPVSSVVSAGRVSPSRGGGGSGGGEGVTNRSPTGPPRRGSNAAADGAAASSGGVVPAGSGGGGATVRETIGVRNDKVGLLIGRGGVHVQNIQDRSGASVQVHKDTNTPPMNSGSGVVSAGAGGLAASAAGGRTITPAVAAAATESGTTTAAADAVGTPAGGAPTMAVTGGAPPPALPPLVPPILRAVTITGTRGAVELAKSLISDRVGGIHPPPPGTAVHTSHHHHYHGPHHHGHHGHHHPHGGFHGVLPPPVHLGPAAFQHHVAVAAAASATAGGGTSPPQAVPQGVGAGALGANGIGSPPSAVPGPGPGGVLGAAAVGVTRLPVSPLPMTQQPYPYPYPPYMYTHQGVPPGHVPPPPVFGSPPYDAGVYAGSPGGTGAPAAAAVSANGLDMRTYYMAYAQHQQHQQQLYARQHQQQQQQAAAAAAAAAATAGGPRQGVLPAAGVPTTPMYGYGALPTAPPLAVGVAQPVPDGDRRPVEDGPAA